MREAKVISGRVTIGITGAQGVGKSTFCQALAGVFTNTGLMSVHVLPSIGDSLKEQGVAFGSSATAESVLAIYSAHMHRERMAPKEGIILMDRCAADALCYTRALQLNSALEVSLLTEASHMMAKGLDLIVHLERRGIFEESSATHETPELRRRVAGLFPSVLEELGRPYRSIYSADKAELSTLSELVRTLVY